MSDNTFLLLGGAGLVGLQVARAIAREIEPQRVVIASLFQAEVRDAVAQLNKEFRQVEWVGVWGDVFVRAEFTRTPRRELLGASTGRVALYDDMFGDLDAAYERAQLTEIVRTYRPNVIVDSINTATGISYQDAYTASVIARQNLDALFGEIDVLVQTANGLAANGTDASAHDTLAQALEQLQARIQAVRQLRPPAQAAFESLLISQAVPQLVRHVVMILRAMDEVGTRLYLKIGTTGTGGMGLNIPYTHGEDKPSAKLMSKTAVGFAHTGLMFLMARTPDAPIVKEIKPAAMIGYADISMRAIRERGKAVLRYAPKAQKLDAALTLRDAPDAYQERGELNVVIIDTGENGVFAKGEFEAITAMNQMEFITPEEIASKVVLEIMGVNTGNEVLSALDSTVLNPSYRAGNLRRAALSDLAHLEDETNLPSVALGQLGPPELSKLLFEAFLLRQRYHTLAAVLNQPPEKIARALAAWLKKHPQFLEMIVSVGLPVLAPDGATIWRGPLIRIPERADTNQVPLTRKNIDAWARKGWVDLRAENFVAWRKRFERMERTRKRIRGRGSAAVTTEAYLFEEIRIGEVVAWVFNNEAEGYRIK